MSLRVTHAITGLETGGAEILLARLIEHQRGEAFEQSVVSLRGRGKLAERIEAAGAPVTGLSIGRSPAGWRGIRSALRATRPDVVQTWLLHANVIAGFAATRLAPVVWGVHMSEALAGTHGVDIVALQRLEKAISGRVPEAIVACSQSALSEMQERGYPSDRTRLVANGFDLDEFRPDPATRTAVRGELGIAESAPVIGHFARFHPMKDHRNLVDSARIVLGQHPDTVFLLCGADVTESNPELMSWTKGLGASVRLMERRDDVPELLRAVDLVTLSSASGEALPLTIGEAMASGAPVVATRVGDSASVIGETGEVVAPRDPEALAAAILRMLGRADLPELGLAARQRIADHFSIAAMSAGYTELWSEAAGSRTA